MKLEKLNPPVAENHQLKIIGVIKNLYGGSYNIKLQRNFISPKAIVVWLLSSGERPK